MPSVAAPNTVGPQTSGGRGSDPSVGANKFNGLVGAINVLGSAKKSPRLGQIVRCLLPLMKTDAPPPRAGYPQIECAFISFEMVPGWAAVRGRPVRHDEASRREHQRQAFPALREQVLPRGLPR